MPCSAAPLANCTTSLYHNVICDVDYADKSIGCVGRFGRFESWRPSQFLAQAVDFAEQRSSWVNRLHRWDARLVYKSVVRVEPEIARHHALMAAKSPPE